MYQALRANLRNWVLLLLALVPTCGVLIAGIWLWSERGEEIEKFEQSLATIETSFELFSIVSSLSRTEASLHAAALSPSAAEAGADARQSLADLEEQVVGSAPRLGSLLPQLVEIDEAEIMGVVAENSVLTIDAIDFQRVGQRPDAVFESLASGTRSAVGGLALPYNGNPNIGIGALYDSMIRVISYHDVLDDARGTLVTALVADEAPGLQTLGLEAVRLEETWNDIIQGRVFGMFDTDRVEVGELIVNPNAETGMEPPEPLTELLAGWPSASGAERSALILEVNRISDQVVTDVDTLNDAVQDLADIELARLASERRLTALAAGLVSMLGVVLFSLTTSEIQARKSVERAHGEAIDQLAEKAHRDPTTGAWNRRRLEESLSAALRRSSKGRQSVVLVYIDLDSFKAINDVWGHATGDAVLRIATRRLSGLTYRDIAFELTRFGGDEFVLFGEVENADHEWLSGMGDAVLAQLGDPMAIDGRSHSISASIGIAMSAPTSTIDTLLLEADSSLIHAKRNKRGSAVVYDREMSRTGELLQALPSALAHGEIRCHVQPVFDLNTGGIVHAELLARWHRPNGETVSPGVFVPLVESFGLADQLTESMLACVAQVVNSPDCPKDVRLWINLSPRELEVADFARRFTRRAIREEIDPARLGIEITETAAVRDPAVLAAELDELRQHGIRVAIDDFGSGYSPLGYLRDLPIDAVKLDRSLVHGVHRDDGNQSLVNGIVGLLASLGVDVTAEGVEDERDRQWLHEQGVVNVQGFLLGRPVAPQDMDWNHVLGSAPSALGLSR